MTYNIGSDNDMDLNLNIGTYKNKTSYFDFFRMEYKEVVFSIEQQQSELIIGKDYINANDRFFQESTRSFSVLKDIG